MFWLFSCVIIKIASRCRQYFASPVESVKNPGRSFCLTLFDMNVGNCIERQPVKLLVRNEVLTQNSRIVC